MKRVVAIDCDGPLGDFVGAVAKLTRSEPVYPLERMFDDERHMWRVIQAAGAAFHRMIDPHTGAKEAVDALRKEYKVICVTSPPEDCFGWETLRRQWLKEHFGFTRKEVVFASDKGLVAASVLIDDFARHINEFSGRTFWVRRPWNANDEPPVGAIEVGELHEAATHLLKPDFWNTARL